MIFLTGMPRCGSTWAATALASLTKSRYVHEPLNAQRDPRWAGLSMRYFRRDACDRAMIRHLKASVRARDTRTRMTELLRGRKAAVLKEVHGTLAVECVDRHLMPDVVIMTRHPCGVAASWKGLGWTAEPWAEQDRLLTQPQLVEDYLLPFATHILASREPFFRVGAYWGAIYYVLHRLAASHRDWQWVTHEDLSTSPQQQFTALLQAFGRTADPDGFAYLTGHDRPRAPDEGPYDTYREARSERMKWKARLSQVEIDAVLAGAEPFGVEELLRTRVGLSGLAP